MRSQVLDACNQWSFGKRFHLRRKARRFVQPLKQPQQKTNAKSAPIVGEIVAAFGRRFHVELPNGATLECVTRGRKSEFACGDKVHVQNTTASQGVIEEAVSRN